ncbi:hypothetical protein ABET22_02165 [Paenibacillus chibensis]
MGEKIVIRQHVIIGFPHEVELVADPFFHDEILVVHEIRKMIAQQPVDVGQIVTGHPVERAGVRAQIEFLQLHGGQA